MIENIKKISDILDLENQKKIFDNGIYDILKIIKEESNLVLKDRDIFIKKNIVKIKSNSNIRFIVLLHLKKINEKINQINKNLTLEL